MKKTSKIENFVLLTGTPSVRVLFGSGLPTQKAEALLLYLIAERILRDRRVVAKEKVVDLLWTGMPMSSALQNLRQTIYQIRKAYSESTDPGKPTVPDLILTDRKSIWIAEALTIKSDLDWYKQRVLGGAFSAYPVQKLIDLYDKPFLENFHLPNAPHFDQWIGDIRNELVSVHIEILERVLQEKSDEGASRSAAKILEYLTSKDPYAEQYRYQYILSLLRMGKRNQAVREYHSYRVALREDLDLEPGPEMKSLLVELQGGGRAASRTFAKKTPRLHTQFQKQTLLGIVVLLALSAIIALVNGTRSDPPSTDACRVAILPLKNHTSKEYLSDGITDDVLAGLTKVKGIRMISRQSTSAYKDSPKAPEKIGAELSAQYLLKGSIAQLHSKYQVNLQFLESRTGEVLWAESFVQDTARVFALQSLITQGISEKINQFLNRPAGPTVPALLTQNPAAYRAYLQGRFSFYQAEPGGLHQAVAFFREALALDADFNAARAWLAWSYCSLAGSWGDRSAADMHSLVKQELSQIEDDRELRSMYLKILGWMHFWLLDRVNAEEYLRQSVSIDPNEEFGLSALAMVLTLRREFGEAQRIAEQALDLNPHFFWNHFVLGQALYYEGRFGEAMLAIENGLTLFDNHQASIGIRSRILTLTGNPASAISYLESKLAPKAKPIPSTFADLGLAYAEMGNIERARDIADALLQRHAKKEKYTAYFAAKIFACLGEHERAITLLEEAFRTKDNELNWLEVDLEFKPLLAYPRFHELLRKINAGGVY